MSDPFLPSTAVDLAARREAALAFLLGRVNYERLPAAPHADRRFKLDRMRTLLNRLGSPDAGLPIVHIAGTKGKGSASALVAQMLHAAGYDVGVFSSPHVDRIEERFCINGQPCDPATLVSLVDRLRPVVHLMDEEADRAGDPLLRLTFFELNTAAALLLFKDRRVDIVVLETGLGGRLDATNVCQSILSAITSISLDHTRQLGSTVEAIAREKAGIIKPGIPVVVGPMLASPQAEILAIARQRGARTITHGDGYAFAYHPPRALGDGAAQGAVDYALREGAAPGDGTAGLTLERAPLGLLGAHQAANAAVALTIVAELRRQGWLVSSDALRRGLSETQLPGRVEIARRRPTVIFDVAHNVASAEALATCLNESFGTDHAGAQRRLLLLSVSRDKDVRGIVSALAPCFHALYATAFRENPRAVEVDRMTRICRGVLAELGRPTGEAIACPTPESAWRQMLEAARPEDLACVTGSFFIVGEVRRLAGCLTTGAPSS